MDLACKRCGETEFYMQRKKSNVGAYCKRCGAWLKWVKKETAAVYKGKGIQIFHEDYIVELKTGEMKRQNEPKGDLGVEKEEKAVIVATEKTSDGEKEEKEGKYCPVCSGEELEMEPNSQVGIAVYDGVLTVTDITGSEILGMYNIKRCPECGQRI